MSARPARWATAFAVLGVAVIAAIVSYDHVETLALANGYSRATGRLLPFSVDGLIVAASMAHTTGTRPALSRTSLILGVLATIAANVVFGARHGLTGEVISAWPAVAFLLASEILVGMLKARPVTVPMAVTDEVNDAVPAVLQAVAGDITEAVPGVVPEIAVSVTETVPVQVSKARPVTRPKRKPDPARVFAEELAAGQVPSLRAVKERCRVGTPRAREIQADLVTMLEPVAA